VTPASEKSFAQDDPPELILFDSSFVVATLVAGERHHSACLEFATRLQSAGSLIVYSSILKVEYLNTWRKFIERGLLPPEPSGQLQLNLGVPGERPHWFRVAERLLTRFLAQFPRREVRVNRRVLKSMVSLMGTFNLRSLDAIQVASALDVHCRDIVSLDDDFKRVNEIRLWLPH
jgi:predicted nucleic acid-binding protein